MAITIDDIYDKEFAFKGDGYDPDDVDRFLDEVCDEMQKMMDQIADLEGKVEKAKREVEAANAAARNAQPVVVRNESVSQTSGALEGILLSAQRLADEAVANAKTRADEIVKDAQKKAEEIVGEAHNEKETLSSQLDGLRKSVGEAKENFKSVLSKYQKMIEDIDD